MIFLTMTPTKQTQTITKDIKENLMKKIYQSIFILIVCSFLLPGCQPKDNEENIKLKARIAALEQQLMLCKQGVANPKNNLFEYDPSETNPNNNKRY